MNGEGEDGHIVLVLSVYLGVLELGVAVGAMENRRVVVDHAQLVHGAPLGQVPDDELAPVAVGGHPAGVGAHGECPQVVGRVHALESLAGFRGPDVHGVVGAEGHEPVACVALDSHAEHRGRRVGGADVSDNVAAIQGPDVQVGVLAGHDPVGLGPPSHVLHGATVPREARALLEVARRAASAKALRIAHGNGRGFCARVAALQQDFRRLPDVDALVGPRRRYEAVVRADGDAVDGCTVALDGEDCGAVIHLPEDEARILRPRHEPRRRRVLAEAHAHGGHRPGVAHKAFDRLGAARRCAERELAVALPRAGEEPDDGCLVGAPRHHEALVGGEGYGIDRARVLLVALQHLAGDGVRDDEGTIAVAAREQPRLRRGDGHRAYVAIMEAEHTPHRCLGAGYACRRRAPGQELVLRGDGRGLERFFAHRSREPILAHDPLVDARVRGGHGQRSGGRKRLLLEGLTAFVPLPERGEEQTHAVGLAEGSRVGPRTSQP